MTGVGVSFEFLGMVVYTPCYKRYLHPSHVNAGISPSLFVALVRGLDLVQD